ncbi:MAG: DNA (cytosine-5-)-methyltransferase [Elusimicrobiota bacterium]|jgi:DNA (cytosine-5)-methyltransferase 1|nr:DNA (cytosine-5-)-methyltransferase [Elusimicrobiota bacterium]
MKTIDLFCGVGGLSLGFEKAGFDIVAAYDYWNKAIDIYNDNLKHRGYVVDLSNIEKIVNIIKKYDFECIIGGPPCQDFSSAGKRAEKTNAKLTVCFAKVVVAARPKLFIMENVACVRLSSSYNEARKIFKDSGYGITEIVLDASYCNVPQKRKRFFCIGSLDKNDNYFHEKLTKRLSDKPLTVSQYFQNNDIYIDTEFYYRHPRNYIRRSIFSIHEPSPTIRGVNRPIPPNYKRNNLDIADIKQARPLTTIERSLIQTFPKNWKWDGTKTEIEQMIGNAVPVNLSKYIANIIRENYE